MLVYILYSIYDYIWANLDLKQQQQQQQRVILL